MTFLLNPYVFDNDFGSELIAAYSLRNIGDYSGSVILGYRADDASTQQFTASQLTDGTLDTFANGSDVRVQTIYNQGTLGASADATQADPTLMLKIYDASTGTVTRNNKPALTGQGDGLGKLLTPLIFSLNLTTGYSIFTVIDTDYAGTDPRFVITIGRDNVQVRRTYQLNYVVAIQSVVQGSNLILTQTKELAQRIFSSHCKNTNFSFLVNGGSPVSSSASLDPLANLPHQMSIGRAQFGSGTSGGLGLFSDTYFQEVLVFNTFQEANDTAIVNSINSYYGTF